MARGTFVARVRGKGYVARVVRGRARRAAPPQHALWRDCCIQPEGGGNQSGLPFSADPRQRAEAKPAGSFCDFRNRKEARRSLATATGGRNPAAALCGLSVRAALHTHPAKHRSHPLHLLLPLHPAPRRVPVHSLNRQ